MVIGFARAAELAVAEREEEWQKLETMRNRLEEALLARIPDAVIHGRGAPQRAPHITSISVPGTDSESMLMALDLRGIGCSAGSACQSGSITPSHVLTAIGVDPEIANVGDSHEHRLPDDRRVHRPHRRGLPRARRQGARANAA